MLKFGDIFNIEDKHFVFLLNTETYCYLATIYNREDSEVWVRGREKCEKKAVGGNGRAMEELGSLYCFTQLTTESFEKQIAYLGKTETETDVVDGAPEYIKCLNDTDLEKMKKEIKEGAVPKPLKDYVNTL